MASIAGFLNKWQKVDTNKAIDDAVEETIQVPLRLNKEQLVRGENKFGVKNRPYKDPAYRAKKLSMNPAAGGRIDLKLKGDLLNELKADFRGETVVLYSTNFKAPYLFTRFPLSLGLSDDSKGKWSIILRPQIVNNLKKQFNGR